MKTQIIYEDAQMLVCYKPAGLATQTSKVGQQDMVSELKNYLADKQRDARERNASKCADALYLGIIHRLDQPVEGLLVFSKNKKAAASLTGELSEGTLNKQYYAVVSGKPAQMSGELVDYLKKEEKSGSSFVVETPFAEKDLNQKDAPKKAVLQYRVVGEISTPEPITLLDIHIDTGRFHQIRVQLSHAGFPILGDSRYGSQQSVALSQKMGVRNVALCAYHIGLKHPESGKQMEFEIEPKGAIFSQFAKGS